MRSPVGITEGGYEMATNKMRPIHPGEIIREEYLVPMNMSAHALAIELRVPATRINDIVRERRAIRLTLRYGWRAASVPRRSSGSTCKARST